MTRAIRSRHSLREDLDSTQSTRTGAFFTAYNSPRDLWETLESSAQTVLKQENIHELPVVQWTLRNAKGNFLDWSHQGNAECVAAGLEKLWTFLDEVRKALCNTIDHETKGRVIKALQNTISEHLNVARDIRTAVHAFATASAAGAESGGQEASGTTEAKG